MANYKSAPRSVSRLNIALFVALVFVFGILLGAMYTKPEIKNVVIYQKPTGKTITGERTVAMRLPAVTRNDTGVFAEVRVGAKPGTGKIFINLENVLSAPEVGQSARMAVLVASNYTGIDAEKVDFTYELTADASLLEGPSAGASFTAATIAALLNRTINPKVMMTGTINHDGTIGPAGKILEKAGAAKSAGANTLLVPIGASTDVNFTADEFCRVWGAEEYCTPEVKQKVLNISEISGVSVAEVANIGDALKYLLV